MGIKKKFFLLSAAAMLSILVCSYVILYFYLYHVMYDETIVRQRASVELNRQMANNFVQSVYHTAVQVVSDKALGEYLSVESDDPMDYLRQREAIKSQFSHYATHQVIDSSYYYRNTLFLSDILPITSYFEVYSLDDNPYAASNMVFSNTNVKEQDWYKETVNRITYVFNNDNTREFCIARKLSNTYLKGPSISEGHAVMVVSVSWEQLEKVFASVPITPHSGYGVFNQDGEMLFTNSRNIETSSYEQAFEVYLEQGATEFETTISGEKYLVSHCEAEYGIQLLFLTPNSDISDGIFPLMHTYSLIFLIIILISLVVVYFLTDRLTGPLIKLSRTISGIHDTRLFDKSNLKVSQEKELVVLQDSFGQMIDNINQLIEDIQIQSEQQKRSQLRALQAQINPHFIFNAMDMVNWLALTRNCDDIAMIVDSIANLMRYSITDADGMVNITQEMLNIQEFVSIYQLRHNNTLQLENDIKETNITIPKFTLQPLVENAVRHAVPPAGENLIITVKAWKEKERTIIEVTDNGTNGRADQLNRHLKYEDAGLKMSGGFGIRNVNERISLWFADNSGLHYYNREEGGLTAQIILYNTSLTDNSIQSVIKEKGNQ